LLFESNPWVLPALTTIVLALAIELPFRFGKGWVQRIGVSDASWNIIQSGILTLVAFMLGISFSQAEGRFDLRRNLVVTEANAIGTTWLRAGQLPGRDAARFRRILVQYTGVRVRAYELVIPKEAATAQSDRDQARLWAIASAALRARPQDLGASLLMQSLNDTIDVSAEQLAALTHHVPVMIIGLTLGLAVLGAMLIGLGFARGDSRPYVLAVSYVFATVIVIGMMVDLDRPQAGFIRVSLDPLTIQLDSMR